MSLSRRKFMKWGASSTLAAAALSHADPIPLLQNGTSSSSVQENAQQEHFGALAGKTPVRPHSLDLDANYIRMPLAPEDAAYGRLQGAHIKDFVREITAIADKCRDDGNRWWGRIAGTKYDDMTETLVESKFKQFGLEDVHRQYFDLPPQWFPISWDFQTTGSGQTLAFESLVPFPKSAPTQGPLDLDVVWVGLGTEADFAGRDVRGKLVTVYSWPMPGVVEHSAAFNGAFKRAADKGAAAVLLNVAIPGNFQTAVIVSAGDLPAFSLGTDDMARMRRLIEKGPVRAHVALSTENKSGLRDSSVWGVLPGVSDEDIIIMAHHDSFFEGALDNASGMAVMMGLAEYFSKIPKAQRRRTLKFVTTAGHHAGSFGTLWMHDNRATFLAKTALMINCEHVSVVQAYFDRMKPELRKSTNIDARRWFVNGSDKMAEIVIGTYKTFGVTIYDVMDPFTTGDMSHCDHDAPAIQLIESAVFYHTNHDTPEIVPEPGLEAVARSYAKIIDQINKLDRKALLA
jgi:peptidase M28-like protein